MLDVTGAAVFARPAWIAQLRHHAHAFRPVLDVESIMVLVGPVAIAVAQRQPGPVLHLGLVISDFQDRHARII